MGDWLLADDGEGMAMINSDRQLATRQRDVNRWLQLKRRTMDMARSFELDSCTLLQVFDSTITALTDQCEQYRRQRDNVERDSTAGISKEVELLLMCAEMQRVLIEARIELGLSQKDLANSVGLHPQSIWRYEKSEYRGISLSMAIKIAVVLGNGLLARDSYLRRYREDTDKSRKQSSTQDSDCDPPQDGGCDPLQDGGCDPPQDGGCNATQDGGCNAPQGADCDQRQATQ